MVFFSPVVVNVFAFKVNVMDRQASISMGPLQQVDLFLSNKQNQGFGEANGDITLFNLPLSVANDQDVSDSNAIKNSVI
ncbi:hypothetical protein [Neobacillus sp. D3-1R]|uniref:hypothetical protein n=1 Tax=Neobacillus sp. D3-1R TaxID=3445778 RepID=UPI003F9EF42E